MLISATITSVLLFVVGTYWHYYPPKKINHLYGYRTRRSMANQTIWDYANKIGAKMLLFLGWFSFILTLIAYFTIPGFSVIVNIFLILVGLVVGMYWCETQISKKFDRNGNPK